MDPYEKFKKIESTYPSLVKFWTTRQDHDLFFLNRLEFERFKIKYTRLFMNGFLKHLSIKEDEITIVPFAEWILWAAI